MSRRLFALSDPHLSFARPKPMDIFGPRWDNHVQLLGDAWMAGVGEDDVVLLPGDISWAMGLADARMDLEWLAALPGVKVCIRGNHDYWWPSLKKLADLSLPNFHFLQNNHVVVGGAGIGGSRLWNFSFAKWSAVFRERPEQPVPEKAPERRAENDEKIRAHEIERLRRSLSGIPAGVSVRVAMTHYPPLGEDGGPTPLTDLIGSFDIDICVFGHIHGEAPGPRPGEDVRIGGTRYVLASSDYLGYRPMRLAEIG